MPPKLTTDQIQERLNLWRDLGCSSSKLADALGMDRRVIDRFLDRHAREEKIVSMGFIEQTTPVKKHLPKKGKVKRYLLSCAQNNTEVMGSFLKNLEAYAKHLDAEILISGFTYNRTALNTKNEKHGTGDTTPSIGFVAEVDKYITSDLVMLAPTLAFCANMQILPTAVNPVSGLQDYTGRASSIIPHVKVRMEPVGTAKDEPTKHLYTTGTVTKKNYIQQKAGQKAEFHHVFGALVAEVESDGSWHVRQLCANDDGSFDDLRHHVSDGEVSINDGVAAIQWGDIHEQNIDPVIEKMFWGEDGVLDSLQPDYQIFHDLVDGESHNPHEQKNHHKQYANFLNGRNSISREFDSARAFLDDKVYRDWCQSIVAWSNHDEFIRRYLAATDYRKDHENARFILQLENETYAALEEGREPEIFATALSSKTARVLNNDNESFYIEGVQIPFHGHTGVNGSRGSVALFAKMGAKTMTGHSHAAWWINGATSAGTCSLLDLGYNHGFSTWSHTFTVLHHGGKRQQVTANIKTRRWHGG